ncbi:unnamed protein product [Linum trigynum]|uniref:AP180 N-terminal homology (ANTH) domain-containing protein n=1 Tax=Linum trigynum TaxID=586398 RepID=A0AAV2EQU9_9ROSI
MGSSRQTSGSSIESLMECLHATKNAYIATKCLFTIHIVLTKGSFILKDQLPVYLASDGRNFLYLSKFRYRSGPGTWKLSFLV